MSWGLHLKNAFQKYKPLTFMFLTLVALHSIIKIIFYYYNKGLLFNASELPVSWQTIFKISKWSIFNDSLVVIILLLSFFMILQLVLFVKNKILHYAICMFFASLNTFAILLNSLDIFYYRFHNQRVNGDLLYVLTNPFERSKHISFFWIVLFIIILIATAYFIWRLHKYYFLQQNNKPTVFALASAFILLCLLSFAGYKKQHYFLPTQALTELKSNELVLSQNSLHTFIYSWLRKESIVNDLSLINNDNKNIGFTIEYEVSATSKKNIVLFIMESVPFDFFDSSNKYFTQLPFFSTILNKSTFYNNAFCYSHESNKGITAILASTPTITDIPLYHSSYLNLPITKVGNILKQQGYQSFFCIGDNYDDFGFAKCANWLGFDNYYSKESIPNYKKLPSQAMGIHDEYVLNFMTDKINQIKQPFFATNFNISTHYDYELPKHYSIKFPANYSTAMKAMVYYDSCLNTFFTNAKKQPWYSNTVFIFCSDHWMVPNEKNWEVNTYTNYKIPIIIYNPSTENKKVDSSLTSQFDILPTILDYSGYKGKIFTYGKSLISTNRHSYTISKISPTIYQIVDTSYILGLNVVTKKAEYLYNYKAGKKLSQNLINAGHSIGIKNTLEEKIKAVLQQTALQYKNQLAN